MQYILRDLDYFKESFPLYPQITELKRRYRNTKGLPDSYFAKAMKDLFYATVSHYETSCPDEIFLRFSYVTPEAYYQKRMIEYPTEAYEYNNDPMIYNHRMCQHIVNEMKTLELWYEVMLPDETFQKKVATIRDFWIPHLQENPFEMTPKMYGGVKASFGDLAGPSIGKYIEQEARKQPSKPSALEEALEKIRQLEKQVEELRKSKP